jgi:DNA-binding transcriptional ArsR family regulator
MTKNSPARATGAYISIVGHVTRDELRRELNSTDLANGFANRILWICTTRSKELPEGGDLSDHEIDPLVSRLKDAVTFARNIGEMKRDDAIRNMWADTYHELTAGTPGLLGAVTSRAVPQTMRLACLYALLDRSGVVRAEHLLAGIALWEYCHASAKFIFGDALGDPTADAILRGLRDAQVGLDRTSISSLFSRHAAASEISRALSVLQEHGLAEVSRGSQDAAGRPCEVWSAVGSTAKRAK